MNLIHQICIVVTLTQHINGVIAQPCEPNQFLDTSSPSSTCVDCVNGDLDFDLSSSPPIAIGCICPPPSIEAVSVSGGIECIEINPTLTSAPAEAPAIAVPTIAPTDELPPAVITPTLTTTPVTAPNFSPTDLPSSMPTIGPTVVAIMLSLAGVSADEIEGALEELSGAFKDALGLGPEFTVTASIIDDTQARRLAKYSQVSVTNRRMQENSVDVLIIIEGPPTEPGETPITPTSIIESVNDASDELNQAIQESSPVFMNLESLEADVAPTESPTFSPTASPVTPSPTTLSPVVASPTSSSPVTSTPVTSTPATANPVTANPVTANPVTANPVVSSSDEDDVCVGTLLPTTQMQWKILFICKEFCVMNFLVGLLRLVGFKVGSCIA